MREIFNETIAPEVFDTRLEDCLRPRELREGSIYEAHFSSEPVAEPLEERNIAVFAKIQDITKSQSGDTAIDLSLLHVAPDADVYIGGLALETSGEFIVPKEESPVVIMDEDDEKVHLLSGFLSHITDQRDFDKFQHSRMLNTPNFKYTDWLSSEFGIVLPPNHIENESRSSRFDRSDCVDSGLYPIPGSRKQLRRRGNN